jgi:type IV pilus assembly protein PilW
MTENPHFVNVKKLGSNNRRGDSAGFTLIEMLIAMAILAIVSSVAYGIFASLTRSYTSQNVTAEVQQNLRIGIEHMLRDVRLAGLDPLKRANAGIVYADQSTLHFTADKNMDGDVSDPGEDLIYEVVDGNFTITDDQGTLVLEDKVIDFSLTCFDRNGVETSNPDEIRSVEILLTVQAPAGHAAPVERTYNTRVRCRNLGL